MTIEILSQRIEELIENEALTPIESDKLRNDAESSRHYVNPIPLVASGNLSDIYRSKFRLIQEFLNPEAFTVNEQHPAQVTGRDKRFIKGVEIALKTIPVEGTYFVVNVGHAHLIPVGKKLFEQGVDCYFCIPSAINDRFHEALKFWAGEYEIAKKSLEQAVGFATLIDCHRGDTLNYALDKEHLPSAEKLKEIGIKRVVCLMESEPSRLDHKCFGGLPPVKDLGARFEEYDSAGLQIDSYGIDYDSVCGRYRDHDLSNQVKSKPKAISFWRKAK